MLNEFSKGENTMNYGKIFLVALAIVSGLSPAALASPKHHAHARDFYARATDDVEIAPTLAVQKETHGGDCFKSLTPVELTRGIRHWTGNC